MRRFGLIPLLLLLMAGCMTTPRSGAAIDYHVIRHLHTPEGLSDPDLTEEGQFHAQLLARWFDQQPPKAIYVSPYKRTRQTAGPLAQALGLERIEYDPADTPGLIERVKAGPKPALIVGHSNTVPDIVEQLGGARPGPLVHEDFGDIWQIGPDGRTLRLRLSD